MMQAVHSLATSSVFVSTYTEIVEAHDRTRISNQCFEQYSVGTSPKICAIVGNLLEEEVVSDELVLSLLVHAVELVEGTLKVTLEGREGFGDLFHDLESLLLRKCGSEGVVSEVSADSDSC